MVELKDSVLEAFDLAESLRHSLWQLAKGTILAERRAKIERDRNRGMYLNDEEGFLDEEPNNTEIFPIYQNLVNRFLIQPAQRDVEEHPTRDTYMIKKSPKERKEREEYVENRILYREHTKPLSDLK